MAEATGERARVGWGTVAMPAILILLTTGVFVWLYRLSGERARAEFQSRPATVSLGDAFTRPVGADRFVIQLALEIDPTREDRERLRAEIEARRESLRSIVNLEILDRLRDVEFQRGPALVEKIRLETRDRLNRELAAAGLGASVIAQVLVTDVARPPASP